MVVNKSLFVNIHFWACPVTGGLLRIGGAQRTRHLNYQAKRGHQTHTSLDLFLVSDPSLRRKRKKRKTMIREREKEEEEEEEEQEERCGSSNSNTGTRKCSEEK